MSALLLLLSCGPRPLDPLAPPPVDLQAAVASAKVDAGAAVELTVTSWAAEGWRLERLEPAAEGMEITAAGQEGPTRVGDRDRMTWHYTLSADPGSYVIQPGAARALGPGEQERELTPAPIFVDVGVEGPSSELAELELMPPPASPPWGWIAAGALAGGALLGGLLWWRRRPVPQPPPEPIDAVALRQWRSAREAGLDDQPLAIALSAILRAYLEARYGFPATAATSREVLAALEEQGAVDVTLRMQLTAVLEANDRLKFAREGGGEAFFAELDRCFADVVAAGGSGEVASGEGGGEVEAASGEEGGDA